MEAIPRRKRSRAVIRRMNFAFVAFVTVIALSVCRSAWAADEQDSQPDPNRQSPTFKRILANWKARQERAKSFHISWEGDQTDRKRPVPIPFRASR
jgi:hypothetical protein